MVLIAACARLAGGRACFDHANLLGYDSPASKEVECEDSKSKRKTAPDSTAVFLRPRQIHFWPGGRRPYNTRKGKTVRSACSESSTSWPPCDWMRVKTLRLRGFVSLSKERFMSQSVTTGTTALSFSFSTQALRVIVRDGEPWFVAADVCEALSIANNRDAVTRLDDDERGVATTDTPSGQQEMTIINESGLYSLILTSRKPEAKKFKKWVTSEVLPAIRKTGRYVAPAAAPAPASEPLTASDMRNITRLVWIIAHGFRFEGSWRNGIWHYLRKALSLPSPQHYSVDQLPRIAQELHTLAIASEQVHTMMVAIEQEAARRIFRRGETADVVVADLKQQALQRLETLERQRLELPTYLQRDVAAITNRTPNGYDHRDCAEVPGYFESKGATV